MSPDRTDLEALPFQVRLDLATVRAEMRYEERGQFISDDDLLDIADEFTTTDRSWLDDDSIDPCSFDVPDDSDYRALVDGLYAFCTEDA